MVTLSVHVSLGNGQEPGRVLKPKLKRKCKLIPASEQPANASISSPLPADNEASSQSFDVSGMTATLSAASRAATINSSELAKGTGEHDDVTDKQGEHEGEQQQTMKKVQREKGECSKTGLGQTKAAAGGRKKNTSAQASCSKKAVQSRKKRGPARKPFKKSSIYKGVSYYGRTKRWEAQIWMSRRGQIYLGAFSTELKAGRAYDRAVIHFKENGEPMNFPAQDYQAEIAQLRTITSRELVAMLRRQSGGEGLLEPEYPADLHHLRVDVAATQSNTATTETNMETYNAADEFAEMDSALDSAAMETHADLEPAAAETHAQPAAFKISGVPFNNPPVRMSIDINVVPVDSDSDTHADYDRYPAEIVQQIEHAQTVHQDDPAIPFSLVTPWKPRGLRHDENADEYNDLMRQVLHPQEPYLYHFI